MTGRRDIVLVVDDDLAVRESLKFALEADGLVVHACASGAALLRHPALRQARCIILDHKLPAMDGFEVLAHLAAARVLAPVILLAAHGTLKLLRRAAAAGVRHVLEKPLLDGALMDAVHALLAPPRART